MSLLWDSASSPAEGNQLLPEDVVSLVEKEEEEEEMEILFDDEKNLLINEMEIVGIEGGVI
jgi:hypothetical protein